MMMVINQPSAKDWGSGSSTQRRRRKMRRRRRRRRADAASKANHRHLLLFLVFLCFVSLLIIDLDNDQFICCIVNGAESNNKVLLLQQLARSRRNRRSSSAGGGGGSGGFVQLDLHPTGLDEVRRRRRRRRRLQEQLLLNASSSNASFMTSVSAEEDYYDFDYKHSIYGQIPDQHDPFEAQNQHLQQFYSTRHLSRYEILYRQELGIDLHINWNGTYTFHRSRDSSNSGSYRNFTTSRRDDSYEEEGELLEEVVTSNIHNSNISNISVGVTSNSSDRYRQQHRRHHRSLLPQKVIGTQELKQQQQLQQLQQQQHHSTTTTTTSSVTAASQKKTKTTPQTSTASTIQATLGGGKYDNYQNVPLSQGYGTHFANVWVGTPTPQRKTVIVDTGSHYTAFPCKGCIHCGGLHHTDPYYDPSLSKSFHTLHCDECKDGVTCDNSQCRFSQSYTEGSSWIAIQVQDKFYCGGTDVLDSVEPTDQRFVIDFMFGCQISMTGLFITQLADGIMGMSAHTATLPKQLYDQKIIEHNLFALCYRRELGTSKRGVTAGSMTMGGYSSALDTSPVIYAKNMANVGWYTVYVKGIYIRSGGGQSALSHDPKHKTIKVRVDPAAMNSGKGVIVDSGTTDTYLNKAVSKEFNKAWRKATGRKYSHAPIQLSLEQLRTLPTILVQCHAYTQRFDPSIGDDYTSIPGFAAKLDPKNPNDLVVAIPATSYMDYSPITKQYTSRVYFTESSGGVLGSNAMQGHNVVFDWENGRIGFAESSCAYDKKNTPKALLDEGFSADCLVGDPILSQACIDTVDQRLCKHHPDNIALLGNEVWTAIVESAGTEVGSSCVESAEEWVASTKNEFDEPVIKCQGDGLCVEKRPCQLTCTEVAKATKVKPLSRISRKQEECGDSFWSACDYGCMQSRIVSAAYSDGHCHEVSRETRACHTGACARSDPCRVPFLVHAVIGLRGGSIADWSLTSEDQFVSALTAAASSLHPVPLFEEGDVNVLAVLPWYEDGDGDDGWGQEKDHHHHQQQQASSEQDGLGLKVVLEISVFNPLAKFDNGTASAVVDPGSTDDNSDGTGALLYAALRNITDRFSLMRDVKTTTCRADDLYSLAKKALALKREILKHDHFVRVLVEELHSDKRLRKKESVSAFNKENDPFMEILNNADYTSQSRLIAAWSIRTEIDDEINYYGPPKPWWFRILAVAHSIAFIIMAFMLLTTAWTIAIGCYDSLVEDATAGSNTPLPFQWWRSIGKIFGRNSHRYYAVGYTDDNSMDDVNIVEDAIMGNGTGGGGGFVNNGNDGASVELSSYRGTTPKKRRSTFYTSQTSS